MKKIKAKSSKKKSQLSISKKIKFTKPRKGLTNLRENSLVFRKTRPILGNYAVQASEAGFLTKNQLEAVRIYFKKFIKKVRDSRVFVLVKPTRIVTKRSQSTRMGRGKGSPKTQIALISKGQLIYEIFCTAVKPILLAFDKAQDKLSVKTKLVKTRFKINY
jgi:large subunit ribosomal protein L16